MSVIFTRSTNKQEERKRIRKEQKKEKRLTNSMKYGSPRSSVIGSDNALSQKSEAELQSNKEQPEKNKRNVSGDYEDDDYYVGFTGFDKEVNLLALCVLCVLRVQRVFFSFSLFFLWACSNAFEETICSDNH